MHNISPKHMDLIFSESDKALRVLGKKIGKLPMEEGLPLLIAAMGVMIGQVIGGIARDVEHANSLMESHMGHARKHMKHIMKEELN